MDYNYELVGYLDQLRQERKISIQELTEGIISRRNYSRYLSGEIPINFEILTKLLERLGIPLSDFVFYITNKKIIENLDEIYFLDQIRNQKYKKAYSDFYPPIKDKEFRSVFAKKTIPIAIKLMLYEMNQLSLVEAKMQIASIINLDEMFAKKYLNDDEIEALNLYTRICDEAEKERIADYLLNIVLHDDYKITAIYYDFCRMLTYLIILEIITQHSNPAKYESELIKKVINSALDFFARAKYVNHDIKLFTILYQYVKRYQIDHKEIIFYYLSSILSTHDEDFLLGQEFAITEADIETYIAFLKDESFMNTELYERVMDYDFKA